MTYRRAVTHLKKADPHLAAVIARVGPCRFRPGLFPTHFEAILRAIVYQQISGKAALTIYGRVQAIYGGRPPTPAELLDTPESELREAGLSRQKVAYAKDLAEHVETGELPADRFDELTDEEIVASLVRVKGIGKWTAQMFLMFQLGRLDVLPDLDLGIQKGIMLAYGLEAMPRPREVLEIGAKWSPYATIASWYLWRSLDGAAEL